MVVKVAESDLPELLSWLQQYLPETFQLFQELKNHLRGKFPDLDYYVDRWPEPQAVASVVDPMGKKLESKEYLLSYVRGVFGVTDAAVTKLLVDSRVVDWSKTRTLCAVTERLLPVIKKVAKEMEASAKIQIGFLMKATSQDMQRVPVPEGMKMMPVSVDHIGAVNSTYSYARKGSESFIKEQIHHFPSVLLMTDCGQHVGHMLGRFHGVLGALYVFPQFRRNGHAKVIISQLSQKYFDMGQDAYVFIDDDKPHSVKLHESLGFKTLLNVAWIECTPKGFERKTVIP